MNDIKLVVNLDNKGYGELITEQIIGEFEALLINSPTKSQVTIYSENGYLIYDSMEVEGIMYIPIRVQGIDNQGHRIGFSCEEYLLNEKLVIRVQNIVRDFKQNEIKLMLRIS